jgi:flagellar biogenesis protein FliO
MRIRNKWLLLPPAAALLLFLGPLRPETPKTGATSPADTAAPITAPRVPDLWQVGSTLLGVLLLGGGGVWLFARMRRGPRGSGAQVFTVRQSHRLSAKQQLLAVEFDEQILLIGDQDGRLSVLGQGRLPERVTDEAQLRARADETEEADEGAVPKNLVLPRPSAPPARPMAPQRAESARAPGLNNFRSLLQKAGKA